MRVIYQNNLGEEINSEVLAEFSILRPEHASDAVCIQMLVVKDRLGNPTLIRRDDIDLML